MKKLFEIQTLSECQTPRLKDYVRLSDPVTIITGGVAVLTQLFPNLFGGGRKRLTSQDWLNMFPGNGYWTTKLRDYLNSKIHYDADLGNITEFTRYFVYENRFTLYPGYTPGDFEKAFQEFSNKLRQEAVSGGSQPVGNFPIIGGTVDWQTLLLYGGGALLLITLLNKKRKSKK